MAMKALAIGTSALDVLVQPVDSIPQGQSIALVDDIHITPSGTAAATALTFQKLGFDTYVSSACGDDTRGQILRQLLNERGINTDTFQIVDGTATTGSVVPIRKDGSHPTLHLVGTEILYDVDNAPWDLIADVDVVHYGAPEFQGGKAVAKVLRAAKDGGAITSTDLLANGSKAVVTWIQDALPYVDYLLPNEEQILGYTDENNLIAACRRMIDYGVGCVAATTGKDGAVVVTRDSATTIPAMRTKIVSTDGAGDAFSAGFLKGVAEGYSPEEAAVWGVATASYTVTGIGPDAGEFTDDDIRTKVEKYFSTSTANAVR